MPRSNEKTLFFLLILITVLTFPHANTVRCEDSQAEAEQKISTAEDHIDEAFASVRMAEDAGALVEDLIDKLNAALNLTLRSHSQFLNGNFSEAITFASNATEITEEVMNQAWVRKQEALSTSALRRWENPMLFVVTDAIICLIGVFLIHKWQRRSLMKKKPKLAR